MTAKMTTTTTANSALGLIGNTPMLRVRGMDTGPCELYLKLENRNPGGSIKDRVALSMIEAAEASGALRPGGVVVEATAGNTGLGLALVGALKGYRVVLVIPDKMAREKILHLRALGAEVVLTRSDVARGHADYYQTLAARLAAETPGAFFADQFGNPANPLAHERTTGPEILAQMNGDLDAFIAGVGSGGTLTGCARAFRAAGADVRMVVADPEGSVVADAVRGGAAEYSGGSWLVEGIGEDFVPPNLDLSLLDEAVVVSDGEAFSAIHSLLRTEGILAGTSSGTLLAAALRWCREQKETKRVVTLVCDTGDKYLSRAFDDAWRRDEGLVAHGADESGLARLLNRRADRGEVVMVSPDDTLLTAYRRMRMSEVSQLPVIEDGAITGLIDEEDILARVLAGGHFDSPVRETMTRSLKLLGVNSSLDDLRAVLESGYVGLVMAGDEFLGLLTRSDYLSYLVRAETDRKKGD
ncbi:MAG: pyridoxal-phosphate dependent enzyme [Alphaproteobacteria bacterium]|nr:pyridoxal-phosphate dependent enzyme [Alphaproteobacteria bacterium]